MKGRKMVSGPASGAAEGFTLVLDVLVGSSGVVAPGVPSGGAGVGAHAPNTKAMLKPTTMALQGRSRQGIQVNRLY
jgi:hypothetical protein